MVHPQCELRSGYAIPMASPTEPDRNPLEACFRGWAWLLAAIAVTLGLVLLLLLALGAPLGWEEFVPPAAAATGALVLRGYERLARQ